MAHRAPFGVKAGVGGDGRPARAPRDRRRRSENALPVSRWFPGMRCSVCGEAINMWQMFNWDHVVPMAGGGARGRRNKQFAHVICNQVKGSRHPFSLRTPAEREAVGRLVRPATYGRLMAAWRGD